jgi:hypothetical protein
MRTLAQEFVALPADLIPYCVRQRLGHDQRAVQGQPLALMAGQTSRETFRRPQNHRRPHRAMIGF